MISAPSLNHSHPARLLSVPLKVHFTGWQDSRHQYQLGRAQSDSCGHKQGGRKIAKRETTGNLTLSFRKIHFSFCRNHTARQFTPLPIWQAMLGRGGIPAGSRRRLTVKDGGPPFVNIPHHTTMHFHVHAPYSHPPHTHAPLSQVNCFFAQLNPHRSRAFLCATIWL